MWPRWQIQRLLAVMLAVAVVAVHAVAAPMPMPRGEAWLLDAGAVCHAAAAESGSESTPNAPDAYKCFLACQAAHAAMSALAPAPVARPLAIATVLRPPAAAAPPARPRLGGPIPTGPPLA